MFVKKPIGVGLVIGLLALAFTALPAMAQAAPTLRDSKGIVAVGETVLATSSNLVTVTSKGNLTCSNVTLTGKVTSNPPAKLSGTGTGTGCKAAGVLPVTITSIEFSDEFLEGGTDEGHVKFVYDITEAGLTGCFLEGPISSTWSNGSSAVPISGSLTGGGGSAECPKSGTISGTLNLETKDGTAVTVNNK